MTFFQDHKSTPIRQTIRHSSDFVFKYQKIEGRKIYTKYAISDRPLSFVDCDFIEIHSDGDGGAIFVPENIPDLTCIRCLFTSCGTNGGGGAIFSSASENFLHDCCMMKCSSRLGGTAVSISKSASTEILMSAFFENAIDEQGGVKSSALHCLETTLHVSLLNCSGNSAREASSHGGCITEGSLGETVSSFTRCTFLCNKGPTLFNFFRFGMDPRTMTIGQSNFLENQCTWIFYIAIQLAVTDCFFLKNEIQKFALYPNRGSMSITHSCSDNWGPEDKVIRFDDTIELKKHVTTFIVTQKFLNACKKNYVNASDVSISWSFVAMVSVFVPLLYIFMVFFTDYMAQSPVQSKRRIRARFGESIKLPDSEEDKLPFADSPTFADTIVN